MTSPPTNESRWFACHDCDRELPVSEAAHDFVEEEEFIGLICSGCLDDRVQLMLQWPRREIA